MLPGHRVEDTQLPRRSADRRRTAQADGGRSFPEASGGTDGRYRANRRVGGRRRSSPRHTTIAQCLDWLHEDHGPNVKVTEDLTFGQWSDNWLGAMGAGAAEEALCSTVTDHAAVR